MEYALSRMIGYDLLILLFDLSDIPPSARGEVTGETFLMLWEVLGRVDLPNLEAIPDTAAFNRKGIAETLPYPPEGSPGAYTG